MREELKDARRMRIGYIDRQLNGKIYVYDKMNRKIGEIRPEGNKLSAYDNKFHKIAYWQESNDTTYDTHARKIAKGNILIDLLLEQN